MLVRESCDESAVLVVHGPKVLQTSLLAEPYSAIHSVENTHIKQRQ